MLLWIFWYASFSLLNSRNGSTNNGMSFINEIFTAPYKCDGLCEECEYRCIPKDAPQHLSIDGEMEITQKNGTRNSFLADEAMTTEIGIDSMILNHLLSELRDSDPESYQILMVLADGLSERASAEKLNMPRNTFVYKKNQLLKRIRENF